MLGALASVKPMKSVAQPDYGFDHCCHSSDTAERPKRYFLPGCNFGDNEVRRGDVLANFLELGADLVDLLTEVGTHLLDLVAEVRADLLDLVAEVRAHLLDLVAKVRAHLIDSIDQLRSGAVDLVAQRGLTLTQRFVVSIDLV